MVAPAAAKVVLVPFPFSDLSRTKLRPAVVIADAGRDDWVLCQITSNPYGDPLAVEISEDSFSSGSLRIRSYARPGKLFTAHAELIVAEVGVLHPMAFENILAAVLRLLRASLSTGKLD
ncbi:MAG: type II toxin-antitoxin system PemK/MazF family toxin [Smithellaceae bacterium]|nr:type II toxin-antitoxin system PemK/MazF family toxin [Smithellaceae bacterium]